MRRVAIACMLLLAACTRQSTEQAAATQAPTASPAAAVAPAAPPPGPTPATTPAAPSPDSQPSTSPEQDMDKNLQADPALAPVDGADVSPLPDDVLVRYQMIRLGVGCRGNYRFRLHADGRVFLQENAPRANCEPPRRFDAPYPDTPTTTLSRAVVDEIVALVRSKRFFDLSAGYRAPQRVFDGAMQILEVHLDGNAHRVVMEKVEHPAVAAIRDAILTPVYNPR